VRKKSAFTEDLLNIRQAPSSLLVVFFVHPPSAFEALGGLPKNENNQLLQKIC